MMIQNHNAQVTTPPRQPILREEVELEGNETRHEEAKIEFAEIEEGNTTRITQGGEPQRVSLSHLYDENFEFEGNVTGGGERKASHSLKIESKSESDDRNQRLQEMKRKAMDWWSDEEGTSQKTCCNCRDMCLMLVVFILGVAAAGLAVWLLQPQFLLSNIALQEEQVKSAAYEKEIEELKGKLLKFEAPINDEVEPDDEAEIEDTPDSGEDGDPIDDLNPAQKEILEVTVAVDDFLKDLELTESADTTPAGVITYAKKEILELRKELGELSLAVENHMKGITFLEDTKKEILELREKYGEVKVAADDFLKNLKLS